MCRNCKCRNCPHENGNVSQVHNTQGAEIVGQVARTIPRIYAALKDCQADHQSTVVEVEGKIAKKSISVLIGPDLLTVILLLEFLRFCF